MCIEHHYGLYIDYMPIFYDISHHNISLELVNTNVTAINGIITGSCLVLAAVMSLHTNIYFQCCSGLNTYMTFTSSAIFYYNVFTEL